MTMSSHKPLGSLSALLCVLTLIAVLSGCGTSGPPFPSSDPPPTFAFQNVLEYNGVSYADAYNGSGLQGSTSIDIVGAQWPPAGSVRAFGPSWIPFGTYFTVTNARWPAIWTIKAVEGACEGTAPATLDVITKLFTVKCVVQNGYITVNPGDYIWDLPPSKYVGHFLG